MYKPGDPDIPNWDSKKTAEIENGWAAVCFHHGDVQRAAYFQGRLPSVLARQFSSHQAFVYLREAWVAILAPLIFQPWLDSFYVQCCDNEASRHALLKGVGKHQPLNCLIAAHWTWHNRQSCTSTRTGSHQGQHLRWDQPLRTCRRSRRLGEARLTPPSLDQSSGQDYRRHLLRRFRRFFRDA